jgi:hypothetical protein
MGFRIALASAAVNILLGLAIVTLGPDAPIGARRLAFLVEAPWFLVVLPAEVLSAYLTGRGTVRGVARPRLAREQQEALSL